jgi:hypothetical protein
MSDEELDRVVSRRVERPTGATESDEKAYEAADPLPDSDPADSYRGAAGGQAEEGEPDVDSEPRRSE